VEEDIWSPMYGIKGKLDATVQAITSSPPEPSPFTNAKLCNSPVLFTSPMPFEIKTGRANQTMEHRAQTMLYTLLASERYNVKVDQGLLYYTQSEEVTRVPQAWNELRGLIVGRNELAGWIMRRVKASLDDRTPGPGELDNDSGFLPPTIDNERICKRCFALDSCMLYRKVCAVIKMPVSHD
jgi:DNA replication ATP-dependent helicase Dna2